MLGKLPPVHPFLGALTVCGIAGAADAVVSRAMARVEGLNEAQHHRGPDHRVVVRAGNFTLANTRLAIQEPGAAGNQPFVSADRRYHCVFNGEIYNHRELRARYGLQLRTQCDGEIIPALWSKLGPASLAELRGMFAIALVDVLHDRLYLVRDPFGIKPLHWRPVVGGLLFASELRPLAAVTGGMPPDPQSLVHYLRYGSVAAGKSPLIGVETLPPNTVAAFGADGRLADSHAIHPDWPLGTNPPGPLGQALIGSVDLHLAADVPAALLLSSGIDSAAIASTARHLGRDLHCLTVAVEGTSDESGLAAETARHYGHQFQRVPAALTDQDVQRFFAAMQRPSIDGLNTYVVCRAVHEAGFKVALSGLGGDEAVGGYSHFRLLPYLPAFRALDALPSLAGKCAVEVATRLGPMRNSPKGRRLLSAGGPRDGWGVSQLQRELFPAALVARLTGVNEDDKTPRPTWRPAGRGGSFKEMVAAEVGIYLQPTLLADADSFSMTSSVELRVPFVDPVVFAASLAQAGAANRPPGKSSIGHALQDKFLQRVAVRVKRGFSVPMRQWMSGPLASVLDAAQDPAAAVWSVLDRNEAQQAGLLPLGPAHRWSEAWALAALNAWIETL